MKYKGILRQREPWLKIAIIIAAAFMLYLSITGGYITYAALAVVVILTVFFKKEHIISEEGVDIKYDLFGITHVNRWEWQDITAIKPDYQKAYPNVLLHICKDVNIRDFVFKSTEIEGIKELAKKMNPEL